MPSRIAKSLLAAIAITATGLSCAAENTGFSPDAIRYIEIFKRSSLDAYPNGLLLWGCLIRNASGKLLKEHKPIEKIEIIDPSGKVYRTARNQPITNLAYSEDGTEFFSTEGYARWSGFDVDINSQKPMPKGAYKIAITGSDGTRTISDFAHFRGEADPISGYPTKVSFDKTTRAVSWTETRGQSGYRILVYAGEFSGMPSLSRLVHISSGNKDAFVKAPPYILPPEVSLNKGQKYFIIVASHDSPDNSFPHQNHLHFQDRESEVAQFVAD